VLEGIENFRGNFVVIKSVEEDDDLREKNPKIWELSEIRENVIEQSRLIGVDRLQVRYWKEASGMCESLYLM
jgi:hypothetical protein